jgi:hypothetical protein
MILVALSIDVAPSPAIGDILWQRILLHETYIDMYVFFET